VDHPVNLSLEPFRRFRPIEVFFGSRDRVDVAEIDLRQDVHVVVALAERVS
jgi:hypothetical protein